MAIKNIEHNISKIKKQKNQQKEKVKKLDLQLHQQKSRLDDEKEKARKKLKHIKHQEDFFKNKTNTNSPKKSSD